MGEKRPQPGKSLAETLNVMGLEMIKGKDKLFPRGDQIYILGPKMIPMTITSEHGLTGVRLRRKKGGEGRTHIRFKGHTIKLPDLDVQIVDAQFGVLNRYALFNQEALINDCWKDKKITQGFLFWG